MDTILVFHDAKKQYLEIYKILSDNYGRNWFVKSTPDLVRVRVQHDSHGRRTACSGALGPIQWKYIFEICYAPGYQMFWEKVARNIDQLVDVKNFLWNK
jgi:hypothetical protein